MAWSFLLFRLPGAARRKWRSRVENVLRRIPILGTARQDLALARLATALESLLNAGVPIVTAWELAATASGSPALAPHRARVEGAAGEGSTSPN